MANRNILPGLVLAILAFAGCSTIGWLFAAMDSTGTHMYWDFWHSGSFFSDYFGWVVGISGAIVVFLAVNALLWYRTRRG